MVDAITPAMREVQQDVYRAAQQEGLQLPGRCEWTDFTDVRVGSRAAEGESLGLSGTMNVPLGADGRPVNRAPDRELGDAASTHLLQIDVRPAMGFDGDQEVVKGYIAFVSVNELTKNRVVVAQDSMDDEASRRLRGDRAFHEYMNDPTYRDADLELSLHPTREAAVRAALQRISSGGVVDLPEFTPATKRRIRRFALVLPALAAGGLLLGAMLSGGGDEPTEVTDEQPLAQDDAADGDGAAPVDGDGVSVEQDAAEDDGDGDGDAGGEEDADTSGGDEPEQDGPLTASEAASDLLAWRKAPLIDDVDVGLGELTDVPGDWIYSISTTPAGRMTPEADIIEAIRASLETDAPFAADYPCGLTEADLVVRCVADLPDGGPIQAFAMQLAGPVDDSNVSGQTIHSLVLDQDGAPDNNWTRKGDFDWDYFLGTDTWFQLMGEPSAGTFELTASAVSPDQQIVPIQTPVKAIVAGDVVAFFVPETMAPPGTGVRLSAFAHDGSYAPEMSGGDVTGADPTGPLWRDGP